MFAKGLELTVLLDPSLIYCATLASYLTSVPQSPHVDKDCDNNAYIVGILQQLSVKCPKRNLVLSKCTVDVRCYSNSYY